MKTFKAYTPDQLLLLSPALQEWLPEGHSALFVSDVVDALDLTSILATYDTGDGRGQRYHPALLVMLLVYAYCTGKPSSSRQIERATYEEVPNRVLAANQHPDHDTLAAFRQQHLAALAGLFGQGRRLCQRAGLVTLGHVALDGTKVLANASKHKAMSYGRMAEAEQRLEQEIAALLAEAQRVDAAEDGLYGPGRRGDELPAELARRACRLAKIPEAKAKAQAAVAAAAAQTERADRERRAAETGRKPSGPPPTIPDPTTAIPPPKAQRNFTDPESRIMKDGATKTFVQAYNAQAVVDGAVQVIVAAAVTQEANDKKQLVPLLTQSTAICGQPSAAASADSGYCSEAAVTAAALSGIDLYVAVDRQQHGQAPPGGCRAGARPGRRDGDRADARQDPDRGRARRLRAAQGDQGTGVRADQGRPRLPTVLVPRPGQGPGGMAADLPDAEPAQAVLGGVDPPGGVKGPARGASPQRGQVLQGGRPAPTADRHPAPHAAT